MRTDNQGQVAMAMGSAVVLVLFIALVAISITGTLMTVEEIENVVHPIEREVQMATCSLGSIFPIILIAVLVLAALLFILSSVSAFGGGEYYE